MRKGGVVTRRRQKRALHQSIRRRATAVGLVVLLGALAMSPSVRARLVRAAEDGVRAVGAFSSQQAQSAQILLDRREVYALQLGVFDSEERAQAERQRLAALGVPCVIWRRDKLRLICAVSGSREAIDPAAAAGNEAYIVRDTLKEMCIRINRSPQSSEAEWITRPDAILTALLEGASVDDLIAETRHSAQAALSAHEDSPLLSQLSKILLDWCAQVEQEVGSAERKNCAVLTMCCICREWRTALLESYERSAQSTASAQRTPSTAADVMPPA